MAKASKSNPSPSTKINRKRNLRQTILPLSPPLAESTNNSTASTNSVPLTNRSGRIPSTKIMVNEAIQALNGRKGFSLQALKKRILSSYGLTTLTIQRLGIIKKLMLDMLESGRIINLSAQKNPNCKGLVGMLKLTSQRGRRATQPASRMAQQTHQERRRQTQHRRTTKVQAAPSNAKPQTNGRSANMESEVFEHQANLPVTPQIMRSPPPEAVPVAVRAYRRRPASAEQAPVAGQSETPRSSRGYKRKLRYMELPSDPRATNEVASDADEPASKRR